MDNPRTGSIALGLKTEWRYSFVPMGSTLAPIRGCVCLDVGNTLAPGILDTHRGTTGADSTTQLVLARPELAYDHLLGALLDRADRGEDLTGVVFRPMILTHAAPDFDAVVSTLLMQELIENGAFPWWADALAAYASEVDQGKYQAGRAILRAGVDASEENQITALISPVHAAFLAVQCISEDERRGHEWSLRAGLELVRTVANAVAVERRGPLSGGSFYAFQPGADAWQRLAPTNPLVADIVAMLAKEPALWKQDVATATQHEVTLPADDGEPMQVRALFLGAPPESRLNKYWARNDQFPYFVCPYDPKGRPVTPGTHSRVVLSLDPNFKPGGKSPSLLGLGFALERAETEYRQEHGRDERIPVPRFADGSCTNDDPWYDGRGHFYTIVDSPHGGTVLPYAKVMEIARSSFWEPPLEGVEIVVVQRGDRRPIEPWAGAPVAGLSAPARQETQAHAPQVQEMSLSKAVPLSALETWLADVLTKSPGSRMRVSARHTHAFWPADAVIKRLAKRFGSPKALGDQDSYFGPGLGWAVPRHEQPANPAGGRDAFITVTTHDLTLQWFAEQAGNAASRPTAAAGPRDQRPSLALLRRDFLHFRVTELDALHHTGADSDASAAALADSLQLRERAERTKEDLDELGAIEGQFSAKVLEALLVVVGVAGVAQTVAAVFAMSAEQRTLPFWGLFWGLTCIPVLIASVLIWRREEAGK